MQGNLKTGTVGKEQFIVAEQHVIDLYRWTPCLFSA